MGTKSSSTSSVTAQPAPPTANLTATQETLTAELTHKSRQEWTDLLLAKCNAKSTELDLSDLTPEDVNNIPWELLPQMVSITHLKIENFPCPMALRAEVPKYDRDQVEQLFPSQIYEMTSLQSLSMNGYPFEYISPNIGNLVNLTELSFLASAVICLPAEIGRLRQLTTLRHYCSHSIAYAPFEITQCPITKTYISRRPNYIYNGSLLPPLPKPQSMANITSEIKQLCVEKHGMLEGLIDAILAFLPAQPCSNAQCKNCILWRECAHYAWSVYKPGADPVCLLATMCSPACVESIGDGKRYYMAWVDKHTVSTEDVADAKLLKKAEQLVYMNVRVDAGHAADTQVACKSLGWSSGIQIANDLRKELESFEYFWTYKLGIKYTSYEIVEGMQNENNFTNTHCTLFTIDTQLYTIIHYP